MPWTRFVTEYCTVLVCQRPESEACQTIPFSFPDPYRSFGGRDAPACTIHCVCLRSAHDLSSFIVVHMHGAGQPKPAVHPKFLERIRGLKYVLGEGMF